MTDRHASYALCGLAVLAATAFTLSGCSPDNAANTSSTSTGGATGTAAVTLSTPGTLTVCSNVPFKPMEYNDDNGQTVGFDIDTMQLVADKLGVKMSVVATDFDQITSGAVFAANKCDIGASAITITDARKQAVLFSQPYFSATQVLVVKSGSGITDLSDLSGKVLAVQTATTGADYANDHASADGFTVKTWDDASAALSAILSGGADACLIDRAVAYSFVSDNSSTVTAATEIQTGEDYGFAAKANDANAAALIGVVNQVLNTANTDGTYLKLYQKWIDPQATSASLPTD